MIVAFSISPGTAEADGGVAEAVAEAVKVVRESGLPNETNAMFTNIEGEWDEVMPVIKRAVDVVAAVAVPGMEATGQRRRRATRRGRQQRLLPLPLLPTASRRARSGNARSSPTVGLTSACVGRACPSSRARRRRRRTASRHRRRRPLANASKLYYPAAHGLGGSSDSSGCFIVVVSW